ncbi:MAG: nucleoside deaminase, partial [Bacillota bacterium]|nr:nucleoside deaminase [Bacillota bacterium]
MRKYMEEALNEAKKAYDQGEVPIGAVVEKDGKIIGRGHNLTETQNDPTAH